MKGKKLRQRVKLMIATATALATGLFARAGTSLQWDPSPAPGIQGGLGIWDVTFSNWDNAGIRGQWFNNQGDTAIFGGTAGGQIQVLSAITANALQFDQSGYTIGQSTSPILTLSSGSVIANADASILAPVSTSAGFTKSGAGTLIFLGGNTIRGTLTLSAGTLSFSSESNLGGAANDIELSGGGIRYAGSSQLSLSAGHTLIVDSAGGRIELPTGGLLLDHNGQLDGPGTLTKLGPQTFQIASANLTFTGSIDVSAGTLQLQNISAINARLINLSGGILALRGDQPLNFQSSVNVSADSTINVDRLSIAGMANKSHALGDTTIASNATLTVTSGNQNFLGVHNLAIAGNLRLSNTGVMLTGALSGSGPVVFGLASQPPESFSSGLIFANGLSQTIANPMSADPGAAGPVFGEASATTVTYSGAWAGGSDGARSAVVLHDGSKFIAGASARIDTTATDLVTLQPFVVIGTGQTNTFELDASFIADHTSGGTIADGFSSLEIRDATLLTRSSAGLPAIVKKNGFGGTQRAGNITLSGTTGARWQVTGADQQYDGGVTIASSATIQTDKDLTHTGTVANKFDAIFQIPIAGAVLAKEGPGWLNLSGSQGYAAGSKIQVNSGGVRFETDPGAGWYDGNFTRGIDGNVATSPVVAGTLAVSVGGGSNAATVEFTAKTNHIDSIQLSTGGVAKIASANAMLITHTLAIGTNGQLDLGAGQLVWDYTGVSPMASVAAMIKSGVGIVSSAAAANPAAGIGYAEASDLLNIKGNQTALFAGQPIDSSSILVRFALLGDANLDGRVNFADFQRLELAYGLSGQSWGHGDFNYDGVVDGADFKLLYDNFDKSADPAVLASLASFEINVPEPGSLGLFCLFNASLFGRFGRTTRVTRPFQQPFHS